MKNMLSCKQLNERATPYLEGDYNFVQKMSFWMHLAMCVHCRRYIRQLKLAIYTVQLMSRFREPSEAEIEALVTRFRSS